ncbi:MAG TPA: hypothetical protein VFU15_13060, partial [Bacteroidia bacterium]|nr:hypothetical protein [Bacteroidia bacterium]
NGCTCLMKTWTYKNGKWDLLIDPFVILTGCVFFSDSLLQAYVFRKDGAVFFLDARLDSAGGETLAGKKAVLEK